MTEGEWSNARLDLEQSRSLSNPDKIATWVNLGYPVPPPSAYKQELLRTYARAYELNILVETGTYLGEMIEAMLNDFTEISSIELSNDLYARAKERFQENTNVNLFQGDSGQILPKMLKKVRQPALFWLDAHYSSGITSKGALNTPIIDELEIISRHPIKNHLILIDDSRLFVGKDDYPTLIQVRQMVDAFWPNSHLVDRHDVIRIQPDRQDIEINL